MKHAALEQLFRATPLTVSSAAWGLAYYTGCRHFAELV